MIPTLQHSGKGKTMETVKRSVVLRVGPQRRLSTEELMFSNCSAEKTLEVPWIAKRSNQSILKEINPEYSLEGLMRKLQYFDYPL